MTSQCPKSGVQCAQIKLNLLLKGEQVSHNINSRCLICVSECNGRESYYFYRLRYYVFNINDIISTFDQIKQIFEENNFFIVGQPRTINSNSNNQRIAKFFISFQQFEFDEMQQLVNTLNDQYKGGIIDTKFEEFINNQGQKSQDGRLLVVTYQPMSVQAHQIHKTLEEQAQKLNRVNEEQQSDTKILVFDEVLEKFSKKKVMVEAVSDRKLIIAIIISLLYIIFSMILPLFSFYEPIMMYPENDSVFSIYLGIFFVLTIFTLLYFGTQTFKNAYTMFVHYRMFNMDTLLTLGSLAAFIMSLLLIIAYSVENSQQSDDNMGMNDTGHQHSSSSSNSSSHTGRMEQIMDIVHDFESAGLILTVINMGKYLEGKAKSKIIQMQESIFPQAQLLKTPIVTRITVSNQDYDIDTRQDCEVSLLEKGDLIILRTDMKLLLDGVIVKGTVKAVDSICYGQDDPFEATIGSRLKSGADIVDGECIYQIEQVLESSMLFQIADQLNLAQSDRQEKEDGITALLKNASQKFVQGVIIVALIVLIVWIILIATDSTYINQYCVWCFPFERSISILVASCPCALGLAVPSVVVISLNMALKFGILIKKNTIFEQISKVKVVIFDKTGTLFTKIEHIASLTTLWNHQTELYDKKGKVMSAENLKTKEKKKLYQQEFTDGDRMQTLRDEQIQLTDNNTRQINSSLNLQDLWAIIGVLEKDFKHPLASLLFKESVNRQQGRQSTFVLTDLPELTSTGIIGNVTRTTDKQNFSCLIGSIKHLLNNNIKIDVHTKKVCQKLEFSGQTIIMLSIDKNPELMISLDNKPNLRPEAKQVVRFLRSNLKKNVYILSGDAQKTVNDVGKYLEIPQEFLYGDTDAEGKKRLLQQLNSARQEVMMIGDGLNDVLSLQQACVGVSINAKSELNLVASDVIVLNENLWSIVILLELMRISNMYVWINLIWAFSYNIFIAPIAAGAFYSVGFTVSPMISSAAMSVSSIIVVLISHTMRFINYDPSNGQSRGKKSEKVSERQRMNIMINQNIFSKTWDQFKQDCIFDEHYGVAFVASPDLYDEDSIKLKEICDNLPQLIKENRIKDQTLSLQINAECSIDNLRSIIIKMGYLLNIVNSYLYSQNPVPQTLPKNIAVPLYRFSQILQVKPSMGYLLNLFNWRLIDISRSDFQLENLQCMSTFTGKRGEEAFYLTSLMTDIRLATCIQKIFETNKLLLDTIFQDQQFVEINQLVQDNLQLNKEQHNQIKEVIYKQNNRLNYLRSQVKEMCQYLVQKYEEQTIQLKQLFEFLDPQFFFFELRPYVQGFSNKNTFPKGLYFEGVDQYFSTEGASGGNTPTFQIIEKAFGIQFQGLENQLQETMRKGMIRGHRDIIEGFQNFSMIKLFAICLEDKEIIKEFNNVILAIKKFNEKHSYYITHYIERFISRKDPEQQKGTGNSPLDVIKNKYKLFDSFLI